MTRAKKDKKSKIPAWSHQATPAASVAIRELKRVKAEQKILSKKASLLQGIILKEGGGAAHGVRAACRHQSASERMRLVKTKARDYVVLLEGQA